MTHPLGYPQRDHREFCLRLQRLEILHFQDNCLTRHCKQDLLPIKLVNLQISSVSTLYLRQDELLPLLHLHYDDPLDSVGTEQYHGTSRIHLGGNRDCHPEGYGYKLDHHQQSVNIQEGRHIRLHHHFLSCMLPSRSTKLFT